MRTIAATFADPRAAQAARRRLEREVRAEDVVVATAAVSESADGPIDRARTIVAVRLDGDAPKARAVLMAEGGQVVADVELDPPPG